MKIVKATEHKGKRCFNRAYRLLKSRFNGIYFID